MNRVLCSCLAAFIPIGLLGCSATAVRIVKVGPPVAIQEENGYAGEDLYLTQFSVRNKTSADSAANEDALRAQLIDYLKESAKFRNAVDATRGDVDIPPNALRLNVDLQPSLQGGDISAFAFYYELYTLFAFSPRKGTAAVAGNATLMKGRRTVSNKSWSSNVPFSYVFFGLFRSEPILAAFRAAYEDVFKHIIVPVGTEGSPTVSKDELRSLVQEGIKEASRKTERVYDSDVDKPGYRAPENKDSYALVIGIEKYQQLPQADFGERDAQTVKDHLLALGYPLRNTVHLSGSLATRSNMEKYLESWLPARLDENSRLLVYFSGHGSPGIDSGQAYLVPWDGDVNFLTKTGYPLKRLYDNLNALKAKSVIVLLDSCFSGAGGHSILPKGTRPLVSKVDVAGGALGKVVVLSASDSSEITGADEAQGHGLFTYYLLKGLNESRGEATLKALYDYLLPRVQDAARQQNRDQTPRLQSSGPDGEGLSLQH